jgi:hypothetical protein
VDLGERAPLGAIAGDPPVALLERA